MIDKIKTIIKAFKIICNGLKKMFLDLKIIAIIKAVTIYPTLTNTNGFKKYSNILTSYYESND
jgi:hypothetical protein